MIAGATRARVMIVRVLVAVLVGAQLACAGAAAGSAGDPNAGVRGRGLMRRDDNVTIGQYLEVDAVAVSTRMVYMATPRGLAIYDRQFESWLPPLPLGEPLPRERITLLAADPSTEGVWIASFSGLGFYSPLLDHFVRVTISGAVDLLFFDRGDPSSGPYVRADGQWMHVSQSGFAAPVVATSQLPPAGDRIIPSTLGSVYQEFPSLRDFERMLTRDEQLRSYPVISGARAPERSEVWLGTAGNGLFKVDPFFHQPTHMPYGLLDAGAGAVAAATDGVWIGGLGTTPGSRGGLTFASSDLQSWRWIGGSVTNPLTNARVNRLAVRGRLAWLATSNGVVRIDTRNPTDTRLSSGLHGLPSDDALSILARDRGVWVGTTRGLAWLADSNARRGTTAGTVTKTQLAGSVIHSLVATGDTLWIGADRGLWLLAPNGDAVVRVSLISAEPRLTRPIRALARADTEVFVALDDDLLRIDIPHPRMLPRFEAMTPGVVGAITALDADANTVWIGGTRGALIINRKSQVTRFLAVPTDLPGEVNDIALTRDYAWIATRFGLARLRRLSDGSVP